MAAPPTILPAPRAIRRHPSWVEAVCAVDLATPEAESRSTRSDSVVLARVCQPSDQPSCRAWRFALLPAATVRARSDFSIMGLPPWEYQILSIDPMMEPLYLGQLSDARCSMVSGYLCTSRIRVLA